MRGLVELKLIWLGAATFAAYSAGWSGVLLVLLQLAVLAVLAWPLQRITVVGAAALFLFTVTLTALDWFFGGLDLRGSVVWFVVGACYLLLYEYIALYEISAALQDYRVPEVLVCILNFGIRFIPIAADSSREALLGFRAKAYSSRQGLRAIPLLASAVFVRLLHKFEDMWISYNVRRTHLVRFGVRLEWQDALFVLFVSASAAVSLWEVHR